MFDMQSHLIGCVHYASSWIVLINLFYMRWQIVSELEHFVLHSVKLIAFLILFICPLPPPLWCSLSILVNANREDKIRYWCIVSNRSIEIYSFSKYSGVYCINILPLFHHRIRWRFVHENCRNTQVSYTNNSKTKTHPNTSFNDSTRKI